ncbi:nicotinate-nucleotide--dimethylbenzimidazole phosphoribosyltransferase [Fusobacterium perfoetens]|uniref:nicotinate-nucleotide--dimethylbenzimidazole phosphoribosyltransferase n=1 Tax=Fusobacterium perfoetens TaxID=852 RepID=UPI001F3E4347|nr:nicotinate-nucleotide--dimethylbenzimidazole phosphoribosyltransferase [Fusobacterium perfoetens]MCF2624854.1 nicotinate-nucleotide--dimethylbenzimidazole phosphoribosyltransferase [Fusobacterium perfoetens]
MKRLEESLKEITVLNKNSMNKCQKIWDSKMKPVGSLGVMENIVLKLAGIFEDSFENIKTKGCHIVAAADNGIIDEGVSSCPVEYTRIVSEAMLNNTAAIGIMCNTLGIDLKVVDTGIKTEIKRKYPNLYEMKVMNGTENFYRTPAMTMEQAVGAVENGIFFMEELENDYDIFSTGEMGIGNTTTSSAVLYSLTKSSIEEVVGRGGGLSDESLITKKKVIFESCVKYNTFQLDTLEILADVGGLDIAFLTGLYIGAAKCRKLILVDGFISSVAALAACKLNPLVKDYLLITHLSEEPGMKIVLRELGAEPFLNMNLRLGEGTGAVLAYPIIKSALEVYKNMKTPEEVYKLFSE